MKYNLKILPYSEFEVFHAAVQAVFDLGRSPIPNIISVTTEIPEAPLVHQKYLTKSGAMGVMMNRASGTSSDLCLWINPQFKETSYFFYMVLAHELTHGYAGLQYGHAAHWRRWFYRVMYHLTEVDLLPPSEDPLNMVCWGVEYTYNRTCNNMAESVLEAFDRAEKDHEQFLENFEKRKMALA